MKLTENEKIFVGMGAVVALTLGGQWAYHEFFTVGSNSSVISNATRTLTSTAASVVDPNAVRATMTKYPTVLSNGSIVDATETQSGNNMDGIWSMARDIFGSENAADVVSAIASCESQNGNLAVSCLNCSLFNVTWTSGVSVNLGSETKRFPYWLSGTHKYISFITGARNQSEGFSYCIEHFKQYLQRVCPAALEAMRARDFNQVQVLFSRIPYNTTYQRNVSNGSVTDAFLKNRFNRLVAAHLISRPAAT